VGVLAFSVDALMQGLPFAPSRRRGLHGSRAGPDFEWDISPVEPIAGLSGQADMCDTIGRSTPRWFWRALLDPATGKDE